MEKQLIKMMLNKKFYNECQWQNEYHIDDIIEHAWKWYNRGV